MSTLEDDQRLLGLLEDHMQRLAGEVRDSESRRKQAYEISEWVHEWACRVDDEMTERSLSAASARESLSKGRMKLLDRIARHEETLEITAAQHRLDATLAREAA